MISPHSAHCSASCLLPPDLLDPALAVQLVNHPLIEFLQLTSAGFVLQIQQLSPVMTASRPGERFMTNSIPCQHLWRLKICSRHLRRVGEAKWEGSVSDKKSKDVLIIMRIIVQDDKFVIVVAMRQSVATAAQPQGFQEMHTDSRGQ